MLRETEPLKHLSVQDLKSALNAYWSARNHREEQPRNTQGMTFHINLSNPEEDGVALPFAAHPKPKGIRRLLFWLRTYRGPRKSSLITGEVDSENFSEGGLRVRSKQYR